MGVRPVLRRFLIATIVIVSVTVIVAGWFMLTMTSCDYRRIEQWPSPTTRYVAEFWRAECGIGQYFGLVLLRDQSAIELPRLDGRPAGAEVTWQLDTINAQSDVYWDGESTLVIVYDGAEAPELVRSEWGGVRIVARRAEHRP